MKTSLALALAGLLCGLVTPIAASESQSIPKIDYSAPPNPHDVKLPAPPPPPPPAPRCQQVTYPCGNTTCTGMRCQ